MKADTAMLPERLSFAYSRLHTFGLHQSYQRTVVMEAFYQSTEAIAVDDLWRTLKSRDIGICHQTVGRLLRTMVAAGLASEVKAQDGTVRYEHAVSRCSHAHLVCADCGAVIDPK